MRYVIITILFIFLLVVGAVAIFGGGNGNGGSTAGNAIKLADYDANDAASVSWTMQGKLVGDNQRKAVRVTVTKSKRTAEILSGYEQRVEKSVEFTNNAAAFATFTRALDKLNFGRERAVETDDERGFCPQGNRFVYRVSDGTEEVMRSWSTSCASSQGSFAGTATDAGTIRQLFTQQVTDYNRFVQGIRF